MTFIYLTEWQFADLCNRTVKITVDGIEVVLAKSLAPDSPTTYHGSPTRLTVFVGTDDLRTLRQKGVVRVTIGVWNLYLIRGEMDQ